LVLDCSEIIHASAKDRIGIPEILEAVVAKVPPPKGNRDLTLRALIFDSWFDAYQGVIVLSSNRGWESVLKGDRVKFMATDRSL
jgi:GTP-binding protein LepA